MESVETLEIKKILQETDLNRVSLIEDENAELVVLKEYLNGPDNFFYLETEILESFKGRDFEYLKLPQIMSVSEGSFTMSFIERENQTRETILKRQWSDDDVNTFAYGLAEFQSIVVSNKFCTLKQKLMGFIYPPIKFALLQIELFRNELFNVSNFFIGFWLSIQYLLLRPFINNKTVHYDLTTFNCAFTSSGKISILDFQFSYFKGDSLLDVLYFSTIPPQRIQAWTFQNQLVSKFISIDSTRFKKMRVRLILLICCLSRVIFFKDSPKEQNEYRQSIQLLISKDFHFWWKKITFSELEQV